MVAGPVFHKYAVAPPAVMVVVLPEHMTVPDALTVTGGSKFTEMLCTARFVQPVTAAVPVTV